MLSLRRLARLAVPICLLFGAEQVTAQAAERGWSVGFAAGLAAHLDPQDGNLALLGEHAAAAVSAGVTSRLMLRVEGLMTSFGEAGFPTPGNNVTGPVRLTALTIGIGGGAREEARYALIGSGVYHLTAHPTSKGDTRPGFYAAYGRPLTTGRPSITLEAQVHWIPGLSDGGEWSLPIRLGLTF